MYSTVRGKSKFSKCSFEDTHPSTQQGKFRSLKLEHCVPPRAQHPLVGTVTARFEAVLPSPSLSPNTVLFCPDSHPTRTHGAGRSVPRTEGRVTAGGGRAAVCHTRAVPWKPTRMAPALQPATRVSSAPPEFL